LGEKVLLDAAVLAIIVGLVAGGRLTRLKELGLRAPWVFVAAAVVQVGLMVAGARGWVQLARIGPGLVVASFALVLAGLWVNRRLPGVWVAGIGVFLNFLVIAANGGSMPVDGGLAVKAGNARLVEMLDSPAYAKHAAIRPETRLRPLADVLPLPMLVPRPRWFSPGSAGDVFVTVGACWLILAGMGAFRKRSGANHEDTKGTKWQEQAPFAEATGPEPPAER
jgi:hypothetical protein